jgi:DnaK suppressor protein
MRSLDTKGAAALTSRSFRAARAAAETGGSGLNKKDLKRFKTMLEESKRQLLVSAKKTLTEESSFDTDDLPDEIDLASSEYTQSMIFRLRDREKFLLAKIDKALARIEAGSFGICEKCEEEISMKRLEARPVTTLCIRCKEEQEQKEKSFG